MAIQPTENVVTLDVLLIRLPPTMGDVQGRFVVTKLASIANYSQKLHWFFDRPPV
jgi:hypothetical protein